MGNFGVGDLVDGKYQLVRLLGEGGWGIVFEGENVRTLKRVAIKILRAHEGVTADVRARFEREAQAAGRIGSEHIVEVFDLGSLEDGGHYMVMELLAGEDLASRLKKTGPMDPVVTCKILLQLLDGLAAAHEAGIMHRDMKPENLFLVPTRGGDEFVKILDFGISKFNIGPNTQSATMTGAVLGSPYYMAPEQARGLKQIDGRTDLYAVGAVMFECLTGRVPFTGDNFNDLMFKIVLAPRPNPLELRPDLDPALAAIDVKAMAVEPSERFQSAAEFRQAVHDWLESVGVPTVPPPVLRRALQATPRPGGDRATPEATATRPPTPRSSAATPSPLRDSDAWTGKTLKASEGTPLSSASTLENQKKRTRKRTMAYGVGAAAVLAAVGAIVVVALGHGRHDEASNPAATAAATAAAPSASPPPALELVPERVPQPNEPAPTPAAVADTAAASARQVGNTQTRIPTGHVPPPPSARAPAHSAVAAMSAKPPEPAPPPATAATTAAPVSTVEGREIRTGL